MSLLASYAGDWRGSALLMGPAEPETFTCRLRITGSRQAKIYYTGRCTLVGLNLAVSGAIAYNNDARRYVAAMTTNTKFSGQAIGVINGSTITFDLQQVGSGEQDGDVKIDAEILLSDGKVTVDYQIEFGDSGKVMTTSVPFSRTGG